MPKYQKTTRIELWRTPDEWQDAAGAWHQERPTHVATYWACFKGRDYSLLYQNTGVWAKPMFEATLTRPRFTTIKVGDHIRLDGAFYIVRQINDLTGQIGHDMTLVCELDTEFRKAE